jgi:ubiquinone/menaquinone biosynthesis C-methylase UbiE
VTTSEAAEYWDEAAQSFDLEPDHALLDPAVRAAWRELLLPLLPAAPARVADLGCGTGSVSVLLAEAGYDVTGLDFSAEMVAAAQAKAAAAGAEARFVVGDASDPQLDAGGFEVVLCRHVLWALPDRDAAIARWVGLLSPDGRLVLVEGRWSTGAGLTSEQVMLAVLVHRSQAEVTVLDDDRLWGRAITDDRYVVESLR